MTRRLNFLRHTFERISKVRLSSEHMLTNDFGEAAGSLLAGIELGALSPDEFSRLWHLKSNAYAHRKNEIRELKHPFGRVYQSASARG